jgi:twitching motility two-component system response regulator PilG
MAKILVVDDEADIVRLVTKMVESAGHTVVSGGDGEAALAKVASDKPDLVILDLHLPKLDGFDVCRKLKADPATKHIPIIMMTAAYTSVQDASKGLDIGADEYVVKPFHRDILLHNVKRLLK